MEITRKGEVDSMVNIADFMVAYSTNDKGNPRNRIEYSSTVVHILPCFVLEKYYVQGGFPDNRTGGFRKGLRNLSLVLYLAMHTRVSPA